jgi:hypothetical protein
MLLNMTANDLDLLRQFARDQSQDAFTALTRLSLVTPASTQSVPPCLVEVL